MKDLHKLIVSMMADNSWHRLDATLDIDGERWISAETNYLAQFRQMSLIYQPPTFDDELMLTDLVQIENRANVARWIGRLREHRIGERAYDMNQRVGLAHVLNEFRVKA
jgi:hypothetical protein